MARAAPTTRSAPPTRSSKRRKTDTEVKEEVQSGSNDVKAESKAEQGGSEGAVAEEMVDVKPKMEDVEPTVKGEVAQGNGNEPESQAKEDKPTRQSKRSTKIEVEDKIKQLDKDIGELTEKVPTGSTAKAASKNKYNLTPGQTPFPDYPHPTPEECQNVIDLLSTVHEKPERAMQTSVTVAGCGEVPAVLDSLMRTMLSAATTSSNSSRAFQNIVSQYGLLTKGIGKGSVDWDKVRVGTQQELFLAIQCGGLAQNKSKNIKAVLDMVHVENQERRDAILAAKKEESELPAGVKDESEKEKSDEVQAAEENVLSLDYLHALSTDEAMSKLTSYPGVGVKTASCVLLFNFGRGSFAVDTHVWRLCRWLGWVPNHATRNQTYSHCDVRIPDDMKYDLHALFWKHGKYCPKCRMIPVKDRPQMEKMVCPINDLIKANGGRKQPEEAKRTKKSAAKPRATKNSSAGRGKKRKAESSEEEDESALSDLSDESD